MNDLVLSNRRPVAMTYGKAQAASIDDIKKDAFDIGDYWQRTTSAAYDAQRLNDNFLSSDAAQYQAFQERIDAIKAATGKTLENPLEKPSGAKSRYLQGKKGVELFTVDGTFYKELDTLSKLYPDKVGVIQPGVRVEERARDIARQASIDSEKLSSNPNAPAGTGIADFVGRTGGYLRDPVNISTLFLGGGEGQVMKLTGSKLASVIIGNAVSNAASQAVIEPKVQAWRKELGLDYGWKNAGENIAFAGLMGGGFAGGLHVGGKALKTVFGAGKGADAAERILKGNPESGDLKTAGDTAGLHIPAEDNHIFETGMTIAADEKAAFHGAPEGLQPAEVGRIAKDAIDHINGDAGPAAGALIKPERAGNEAHILENARPTLNLTRTIDGRKVTFADQFHAEYYDLGNQLADLNGYDASYLDWPEKKFVFKHLKDKVEKLYETMGPFMGHDPDYPIRDIGDFAKSAIEEKFRLDELAKTNRYSRHFEADRYIEPDMLSEWADLVAKAERSAYHRQFAGKSINVQNKPVQFEQISPATVETDARAYQYKDGGDTSGVTDRLRDVRAWDATASGKVFVHERANGKRFIADGHQRLGLAKRLQAAGDQSAVLDAYVFKEKDGWSVADVRALAAKKNMQEGSGTAIDAARILRDRPDLLDNSLPVSGPMMRKATALARLAPDAWGMTLNGMVSEGHAALVGEMVADPALHSSMLKDLAKFDPKTDREARLVIGEALNAGRHAEVQNDMFGSFRLERTLMGERVKVLDGALKALNDDKKLFATLSNNADIIESAGNQLDTAGNKGRAVNAEMIGELLQMMARSRGPVSDALTAAAKQMANGMPASKAAKAFIGDVRGMLEKDGLGKLLSPAEPELKPTTVIEPGSAESKAIGDNAPTAAELEAEGQFSMFGNPEIDQSRKSWDMLPDGIDADGNSKLTTAADLFARADRTELFADLTKSCKG